jgi:hypothetical protein
MFREGRQVGKKHANVKKTTVFPHDICQDNPSKIE